MEKGIEKREEIVVRGQRKEQEDKRKCVWVQTNTTPLPIGLNSPIHPSLVKPLYSLSFPSLYIYLFVFIYIIFVLFFSFNIAQKYNLFSNIYILYIKKYFEWFCFDDYIMILSTWLFSNTLK